MDEISTMLSGPFCAIICLLQVEPRRMFPVSESTVSIFRDEILAHILTFTSSIRIVSSHPWSTKAFDNTIPEAVTQPLICPKSFTTSVKVCVRTGSAVTSVCKLVFRSACKACDYFESWGTYL